MSDRKYAMTKIAAGDYLLPSNDGTVLWRIALYEDGPSHGLDDWPRDIMLWGAWKWRGQLPATRTIDTENWAEWDLCAQGFDSRAAAIDAALEAGEATDA